MRSFLLFVTAFFASSLATAQGLPGKTAYEFEEPRRLEAAMGVHIKLHDENGEAVPGIRAQAFSKGEPLGAAVSGADGTLFLQVEDSGPFRLSLHGDGWQSRFVGGLRAGDSTAAPIRLAMIRAFPLRGRVVDVDGDPVPSAQVIARSRARGPVLVEHGQTDRHGHFEITGLSTGSVEIVVRGKGFRAWRRTGVAVGPGADELEVMLREGFTLEGTVVDPQGHPVADAEITARELEAHAAETLAASRTDGQGRFELIDLPAGHKILRARHADFPTAERSVLIGAEAGGMLEGTAYDAPVEIQLSRGQTLEGRVSDSLGQPLSGATLRLRRLDAERGRHAKVWSDAGGDFRFLSLAAGTYRLDVQAENRGNLSRVVDILDDPPSFLELTIAAGASVRGQIKGAARGLQSGPVVVMAAGPGPARQAKVDGDRFRLDHLPHGRWRFEVRTGVGRAEAYLEIDALDAEKGRELSLELDLESGWKLSGVAFDHGVAVAGAWVNMRRVQLGGVQLIGDRLSTGEFWTRSPVGADGRFEIAALKSGIYELTIRDFTTGLRHSRRLELESDQHLEIHLSSTELVVHSLAAESGLPLENARLELYALDASSSGPVMRGVADSAGRASLGRVTDGRWKLVGRAAGYPPRGVEFAARGQPVEAIELRFAEP